MILNESPKDTAVLSNVGQVGEFRIRNSAKAFSILSNGLYANKIRAIIRELSTNAIDSHCAAGRENTPYDVHLPNSLEPWFSVRDYGTGLTHDQVVNIYTTYFESTKTHSNDFIGALGLGSKSPFGYTKNFTVTAVARGSKGVYTAFINDDGVPSIAEMAREASDEPNGVEVKFAVDDPMDFGLFASEAAYVYKYLAPRPVIHGSSKFKFVDPAYKIRDIIPGVHERADGTSTIAVMGGIAYPVDIPNSQQNLGNTLHQLLSCGLELHFATGEIDIQPSREGLSYEPATIAAFKAKLEAVAAALHVELAKNMYAIPNIWDRAQALIDLSHRRLWLAAAMKYATDSGLIGKPGKSILSLSGANYVSLGRIELAVPDLAKSYNVDLSVLEITWDLVNPRRRKPELAYSYNRRGQATETWNRWHLYCDASKITVVIGTGHRSDTSRVIHYLKSNKRTETQQVWLLRPVDPTKPMDTAALLDRLHGPNKVIEINDLPQRPKAAPAPKPAKPLTIKLREYSHHYSKTTWRDVETSTITPGDVMVYVPMIASVPQLKKVDELAWLEKMLNLAWFPHTTIYGIRNSQLDQVQAWLASTGKTVKLINIEQYLTDVVKSISKPDLVKMAVSNLALYNEYSYNKKLLPLIKSESSKMAAMLKTLTVDGQRGTHNKQQAIADLRRAMHLYYSAGVQQLDEVVAMVNTQWAEVVKTYPLFAYLQGNIDSIEAVAQYINLIDAI